MKMFKNKTPTNCLNGIKRVLPLITAIKSYNLDYGVSDLVTGITIGLTLIPQSLGYASLAGLSPEYGLYSSLTGGFVYAIFGTIPELNIAPTALIAILTYQYVHDLNYIQKATNILCFMAGLVELICGLLNLGFLVDFVSVPVVAAFTSAGALTIATSQIKNLLGLKFDAETFVITWKNIIEHIHETNKSDAILGISCMLALLSMRKLKDFGISPIGDTTNIQTTSTNCVLIRKILWFISVARNAFVVIISALIGFFLETHPFTQTAKVPSGLPNITIPFENFLENNSTHTFFDVINQLGTGNLIVPFVTILCNVAIAKAFANGKVVDASQEMRAVGICNMIGSFFASYPVNASFTRSAIGNASGVRTPLAGIYTGIMVILSLTFLTPYFSYIPKATLAAVIICAVAFMVEITMTKIIWDINKIDLIPFTVTLFACLFINLEYGILVGVFVDIIFLLYSLARPKIHIEKIINDHLNLSYLKITPASNVLFPSAEYVRENIMKYNRKSKDEHHYIVVDCERIEKMDFTAAKCFSAFVNDFVKMDKHVIFYRPKKSVANILKSICKSAKMADDDLDILRIIKCHLQMDNVTLTVDTDKMTTTKL